MLPLNTPKGGQTSDQHLKVCFPSTHQKGGKAATKKGTTYSPLPPSIHYRLSNHNHLIKMVECPIEIDIYKV